MFAVALFMIASLAAAAEPQWQEINFEDGVRVWQREVPGTSLVEFRAKGMVKASMKNVAAVIRNADREKEWMESCNGSFSIVLGSPLDEVSYNRTESPVFFISDRDVVVKSHTTVHLDRQMIRVDFHDTENAKAPPIKGVVRMPKLSGYWELKYVAPLETEVTYQIQADPGGSLPKWIVNWASQSLSLDTVRGLRGQVVKAGYENDVAVLEAAIDWEKMTRTSTAG